ncbi:MAG: hypothetical protein J6T73_03065 [Clostridia bacterium]|nr:hypothetical protein [Clostridia bacterium]
MIEAFLLTLAVIFASLGICDFLHTLKTALLFPGIRTKNYCVVFLKAEYAVCQLRFFSAKLRWYGDEFADGIIAVTDELNKSEIALCEKYCYGANIRLCRFCDINNTIGETNEG